MTIDKCIHCIKFNKGSSYCAYYKKSIAKITSCERVVEYKIPQCPKHNDSMDIQKINLYSIEYECLFCNEKSEVSLSKEYMEHFIDT